MSEAGKTVSSLTKANAAGWTAVYYEESGVFEGVLTADDFVPYTGNQISVNWETEAGTVYGGTVTLNEDGSADVVADSGSNALNSLTWVLNSTYNRFETQNLAGIIKNARAATTMPDGLMCSAYTPSTARKTQDTNYTVGVGTAGGVYIRDETYSNVNDWLTNMGNQVVVYPLATPVPYHFSNVGQLKTFLGTNNVWCDTGDVEVTYPADTKLYIDSLTAPDEDMIADANIASGQYFTVNNKLYLSTAAIAAGASIIPGTNCTETNLAAALNALNT